MRVYLFDIDGTLANGDHRLHHIQKEPKDWATYFSLCGDDEPIPHMIDLAHIIGAHSDIIFASGRSDECRDQTTEWLMLNFDVGLIRRSDLYMRKQGDHRPDDVIKIEMLADIRARGYEVMMVFEDRKRCVDAWRAAGVPCMQVAPGDF